MKKDFFKNRRNAILLSVVLVLLSTLFGVNRSLGAKIMEVSDYFNDGVFSRQDGYRLKSIRSQLAVRADASLNTLTITDRYEQVTEETNTLRQARNNLKELLEQNGSPSELYYANKKLENAFTNLISKLDVLDLPQEDAEYIEQYLSNMRGAASVIENSQYNEAVREFKRNVLSIFPTNLLMNICSVSEPELFE